MKNQWKHKDSTSNTSLKRLRSNKFNRIEGFSLIKEAKGYDWKSTGWTKLQEIEIKGKKEYENKG